MAGLCQKNESRYWRFEEKPFFRVKFQYLVWQSSTFYVFVCWFPASAALRGIKPPHRTLPRGALPSMRSCVEKWRSIILLPVVEKMTIFQNLVVRICWDLAEFLLATQFSWPKFKKKLNQTEKFCRIFCWRVTHYFLKKIQKFSVRMLSNWYHETRFVYCKFCTKEEEKLMTGFFANWRKLNF